MQKALAKAKGEAPGRVCGLYTVFLGSGCMRKGRGQTPAFPISVLFVQFGILVNVGRIAQAGNLLYRDRHLHELALSQNG